MRQFNREYYLTKGYSHLAIDALQREALVKKNVWLISWPYMMGALYIYGLIIYVLLSIVAHSFEMTLDKQLANVATLALVLFILSVLFRPKPTKKNFRLLFTHAEILFPACLLVGGLLLFNHPGWQSPSLPSGGAVASTLWPFIWLGTWLGPKVLSIFVVLLAHYVLLKLKIGFYLYFVEHLRLEQQENYFKFYQKALASIEQIESERVLYCARHIARFLTDTKSMQSVFELPLHNQALVLEVEPHGTGSAEISIYSLVEGVKATHPLVRETFLYH